jgi:hypothetical protein
VGRVGVLALVVAAALVAAAVTFAAQSPQQWRAAMLRAASARHSVHYVSSSSEPGRTIHLVSDVGPGRGIQQISLTKSGKSGRARVLVVDRSAYIRGDAFMLHVYFGFTQAQASRYRNTWISSAHGDPGYGAFSADATFASFLHYLLPQRDLRLVTSTVAGRKVVGVRGKARQGSLRLVETVYAPARGTPLPFDEKAVVVGHPGTSMTRIGRWNEPVHVTAPPHAVPIVTVLAH